MLISPLMGPIIGLGFALATFDSVEIRRTLRALAIGVVMAVGFCALIVLFSPLQTVTDEIAARTRPNLFDLLVALFSGLAGTYAMIRGRHGTIVGVAIATALMPPLAVVGYGLATANVTVLAGSSLLFFTNLMTIAVAAAVLARIYGFAPNLSPRQTRLQATLVITVLIALASMPLALSLKQIAWEAVVSRQAQAAMSDHFGPDARLSQLDIDYDSDPVTISATIFSARYDPRSEAEMTSRLTELLRRPVRVGIDYVRTEQGNAEALEIAAAKGSPAERSASRMAERLALVAGVAADRVLIDRRREARACARGRSAGSGPGQLPRARGAGRRVWSREWSVTLVPPPAPLPQVEFDGNEPTPAGVQAMETAAWAAKRIGLQIGVSSAAGARAGGGPNSAGAGRRPGADHDRRRGRCSAARLADARTSRAMSGSAPMRAAGARLLSLPIGCTGMDPRPGASGCLICRPRTPPGPFCSPSPCFTGS